MRVLVVLLALACATPALAATKKELADAKLRKRDAAGLLVDPAALRTALEQTPGEAGSRFELLQLLANGELDGLRQAQLEALVAAAGVEDSVSKQLRERIKGLRAAQARDLAKLKSLYAASRAWCADQRPSDLPLPTRRGAGTRYAQLPAEFQADSPDRELAALIVERCLLQRPEDARDPAVLDLLARWHGAEVFGEEKAASGYRAWAAARRGTPPATADVEWLLKKQASWLATHAPAFLVGYVKPEFEPRGKVKKPKKLKLDDPAEHVYYVAWQQYFGGDPEGAIATLTAGAAKFENRYELAKREQLLGEANFVAKHYAEAAAAYRAAWNHRALEHDMQRVVFETACSSYAMAGDRAGLEAFLAGAAAAAGLGDRYKL